MLLQMWFDPDGLLVCDMNKTTFFASFSLLDKLNFNSVTDTFESYVQSILDMSNFITNCCYLKVNYLVPVTGAEM